MVRVGRRQRAGRARRRAVRVRAGLRGRELRGGRERVRGGGGGGLVVGRRAGVPQRGHVRRPPGRRRVRVFAALYGSALPDAHSRYSCSLLTRAKCNLHYCHCTRMYCTQYTVLHCTVLVTRTWNSTLRVRLDAERAARRDRVPA